MASSPSTAINPQSQSPLYSKLPQEIRDQIFALALSPYTPAPPPPPPKVNPLWPDATIRAPKTSIWNPVREPYPINSTYSRPSQRAKTHHPINLLLVCKRTYLETAHLPVSLAAHNFYAPAKSGPKDMLDYSAYFARMNEQQRSLVREVRVFANVEWLLDEGLEEMAQHPAMRGVELLTIVVRWCDWRGWQHNQTLSLLGTQATSQSSSSSSAGDAMEEDDDDEDELALVQTTSNTSITSPEQQELEFATHSDASNTTSATPQPLTKHASVQSAISTALAHLPALKTLRISLEAPHVKSPELQSQLSLLQSTAFHLPGKRAGENEKMVKGQMEKEFEWEAPMCAWSDFCAHCGGGLGDDKACEERKRRRKRGMGPRVQGGVVRWS